MTSDFDQTTIAFASLGDATDPGYSSGAPHAMRQGFLDIGCEVVDLFPLDIPKPRIFRLQTVLHRLNGEYYTDNRTPQALYRMAREIERRLAGRKIDFLFSPHSIPVSLVDIPEPIILTHDQTFYERLAYFAYEARPPAREYVCQALDQEQIAFANASLCVYPSQRSLDCIAERNGVPRSKLRMIPWGANLPAEPSRASVSAAIRARIDTPLQITFVGVDWARKGGALVVETCRELQNRGVDVRLLIIGCTPPIDLPDWAVIIPFLDKRSPGDLADYVGHMQRSHFLFMPSRVEAYGHVLCEAAAFGVPSVVTDVGGIPTAVVNGVTGLCLPLSTVPADFANAILAAAGDVGGYIRMAEAARDRYESHLNWRAFARSVVEAARRIASAGEEPLFPLRAERRRQIMDERLIQIR
jgi:glycosyltransferase involved in cell wall biosynthesis